MRTEFPAPQAPSARLPLNRAEWGCVLFAVIVAHAFLAHEWIYPSSFDATHYSDIGRDIVDHGLFSKFMGSQVRTYGYPLILSLVLRAAAWTGLPFVVLLFELQLLAYVAAAFFLRRSLAPVSSLGARIALCGLLVNYYVLIYAPESLSESASLTLMVFAAGWWVTLWHRGLAVWPLLAGSLTVGIALMVRPANVFIVATWGFGVAILCLRQRTPALRTAIYAAILAVAIALPMAPQIRNNVVHYGKVTPLVTADLGLLQQTLGVQNLKYATAMPPVPQPPVYYNNPLYEGTTMSESSPWTWYFDYPLRGAATLGLHVFSMTDQDLLFTYSRDLWPWYRVPLGIVNHGAVALGLLGLILFGRNACAANDPRWRDAFLVLLALIVANLAVYAWTDIEMRYGSALLLALFPLAGYAATRVAATDSGGKRTVAVLGTLAYIVIALILSAWVRDQSAQIREAGGPDRSGSAAAPARYVSSERSELRTNPTTVSSPTRELATLSPVTALGSA